MLLHKLYKFFNDDKLHKVATIQHLWSGYGEIARYYSPKQNLNVIVKEINLEAMSSHPRNFNSEFAHQRKLQSYVNELSFYQNLAKQTNHNCKVAQCYIHIKDDHKLYLILEDLDSSGFSERFNGQSKKGSKNLDLITIKKGIEWLANFHYCFLQKDISVCWPVGTYWHLATRPEEFEKMAPSPLKELAHQIDQKLNQAQFQTLLHGDAKIANFCLPQNILASLKDTSHSQHLAAVDFQYCGRGVGVKDLVYFLGSCLSNTGLKQHADMLKEYYFSCLYKLSSANHSFDAKALDAEWRNLYALAWADFERFLSGWATSHHKLSEYSRLQSEVAINSFSD